MKNHLEKLIVLVRNTTDFTVEESQELQLLLSDIKPNEIPENFIVELKEIIDMMFLTNNIFFENCDKVDAFYKALVARDATE
jgi:hypothetical protein